MSAQPTAESQRRKDTEHIKLLMVFHFVLAGLSLLGIVFLFMHYFMMNTMMTHFSTMEVKDASGTAFPFEDFLKVFVWFYVFMGVIFIAICIVNVLSGMFLRRRKYRIFTLVVAGLNCMRIPFGTALGVCTIMVLMRESVIQSYESDRLTGPAPPALPE